LNVPVCWGCLDEDSLRVGRCRARTYKESEITCSESLILWRIFLGGEEEHNVIETARLIDVTEWSPET
jgi:hypothetical protein